MNSLHLISQRWLCTVVLPALLLATCVAPADAAEWRPIGPEGGAVVAMAAHPDRPEILLAGSLGAGGYRSDDGGATWVPLGERLPSIEVWSAIFDPQAPQRAWAGTADGLFRSDDGGLTWRPVDGGLGQATTVGALAFDPSDPTMLYAATDHGLFRSVDTGGTWTSLGLGDHQGVPRAIAADPTDPRVLLVAIPDLGLFRTTDGGAIWRRVGPASYEPETAIFGVAFSQSHAGRAFAAVADGRLLVSDDRGLHWTTVTRGLPRGATATALTVMTANGSDMAVLWTGDGPWVSVDGAAFTPLASHFPRGKVSAVEVSSAVPERLWAALDQGGIWASDDGGHTWQRSQVGIGASWVGGLALDSMGVLWAAMSHGLRRFDRSTGRWEARGPDLAMSAITAAPSDPSVLYAGGSEAGIVRSTDGGTSWASVAPLGLSAEILDLAVDVRDPETLWVAARALADGADSVKVTHDGGESWETAVEDAGRFVALDPYDSGHLLVGGQHLFESRDDGMTWHELHRPASPPTDAVAFDRSRLGGYYVCGGGRILITRNDGRTWKDASGRLNLECHQGQPPMEPHEVCGPSIAGLVVDPLWPQRLLLGFEHDGVRRTLNRGRFWREIDAGLLNPSVSRIVLDGASSTLYVATRGGGVWQLDLGPVLPPRRPTGREDGEH
jgi:photosystem II stability/assembly factor-like uncharacterized protein